jgi:hypothetical protein
LPGAPNAPGPALPNESGLILPHLPGLAIGSGTTVAVPRMPVPAPPMAKVPKVLVAGDVTVTPQYITMGAYFNGFSYCNSLGPC